MPPSFLSLAGDGGWMAWVCRLCIAAFRRRGRCGAAFCSLGSISVRRSLARSSSVGEFPRSLSPSSVWPEVGLVLQVMRFGFQVGAGCGGWWVVKDLARLSRPDDGRRWIRRRGGCSFSVSDPVAGRRVALADIFNEEVSSAPGAVVVCVLPRRLR